MSMRLLNTTTGKFETFEDPKAVRYAILSHVWTKNSGGRLEEQTYRNVCDIAAGLAAGSDILINLSPKIQNACKIARQHGFKYIWIDTCCINHESSAELSRAINSMYEWYSCSNVCYAVLQDVGSNDNPVSHTSDFRRSTWFKRGWTLQELIAPKNVIFLCNSWGVIGTKHSLATVVHQVTGIDPRVLRHELMPCEVSVAQRVSWTYSRKTTHLEDQAYCLIGIFGVNLTPIYGEGHDAFIRLQEAILKLDPDQSIFAW
ncbi:HET-domain-containing protein, partial [Lentinus brumalis]